MREKKLIPFAPDYQISDNGEVYSFKTNRLLKKRITKGKSPTKYYYSYDLSKEGKHLITRLVMFCFGNHDFKTIQEMPKIILIDNNQENIHISNLKFVTQSELNKIHNIKPGTKCYSNNNSQKIKETEIENIFKLRSSGTSLKEIGKIYDTTQMSALRFLKKYNYQKAANFQFSTNPKQDLTSQISLI